MTRGKPSKEQLDISMPMLENAAKCDFMMSASTQEITENRQA